MAAAKLAHDNSEIDKPFTVSVWEHYDEALLRGDDPRLDVWRSWGVDRVILLMFKSVDFAALNRAAKYLNYLRFFKSNVLFFETLFLKKCIETKKFENLVFDERARLLEFLRHMQ